MSKFFLIRRFFFELREKGWKTTLILVLKKVSAFLERSSVTSTSISIRQNKTSFLKASHNTSFVELPCSYEIILAGLQCLHDNHSSFNSREKDKKSERCLKANPKSCMHFTWLIPFFSKGAGGHKNLFRFVKGLEDLGHSCTIYMVYESDIGLSNLKVRELIREYFEQIQAEVKTFNPKETHNLRSDVVIATAWITAYAALTFDADLYLYFVQDYEPLFNACGSYWHLANNTYMFGFHHITLGPWLASLLKQEHKVSADHYQIVVDQSLYYPKREIIHPVIRELSQEAGVKICFYGRSVTPRRCFEIVVMALYLLTQRVKGLKIACYGWDDIPGLPFEFINLGKLEVEDLADLYSTFDICIAPSATNLALVAHEVMACGCVLMDLDLSNTGFNLEHMVNSYLVKPDPKSMCDGLIELCTKPDLLTELKKKSIEYVQSLETWEQQVKTFESLVKSHLENA